MNMTLRNDGGKRRLMFGGIMRLFTRFILVLVIVIPWVVATVAMLGVAAGVAAQTIVASERYANCMRQVRIDPELGLETALVWRDDEKSSNDKYAAAHCEAVALTRLGQYETAAKRFEALAALMGPVDGRAGVLKAVRAEILAQAGQAWFRADQIVSARAVQTAAIILDSSNAEIRVDRAMTWAADGAYWDAIDDLNVAISMHKDTNQENADVYALRASAYRLLDVLSLAKQDVEMALFLVPNNAEALLEQGIIWRLSGKDGAARKVWSSLVQLHDGTPAAVAARKNLKKLGEEKK